MDRGGMDDYPPHALRHLTRVAAEIDLTERRLRALFTEE